ncbi:hypothetical protein MRX96_018382 [Rhipicephalus microplus]
MAERSEPQHRFHRAFLLALNVLLMVSAGSVASVGPVRLLGTKAARGEPAATTSREAPHEKKARREAALLQEAVNLTIETHLEEERNNRIDTFQALLNCLPHIKVSKFWTVFTQHDCVLFLNLTFDGAPAVRKSVKITEDLSFTLFFQNVEVTKLDGIDIPKTVNDIRCLTRLLEAVEGSDETPTLKSEDKTSGILKLVVSLLEDEATYFSTLLVRLIVNVELAACMGGSAMFLVAVLGFLGALRENTATLRLYALGMTGVTMVAFLGTATITFTPFLADNVFHRSAYHSAGNYFKRAGLERRDPPQSSSRQ